MLSPSDWLHLLGMFVVAVSLVVTLRVTVRFQANQIEGLKEEDKRLRGELSGLREQLQDHATRFARGDEQLRQLESLLQRLEASLDKLESKLDRRDS